MPTKCNPRIRSPKLAAKAAWRIPLPGERTAAVELAAAVAAFSTFGSTGCGYYVADYEMYVQPDYDPLNPPVVEITVLEALIAPTKSDGCVWDGFSCSPPSDSTVSVIGDLVGSAATAAVGVPSNQAVNELAAYLLGGALGAIAKPDPRGSITFRTSDGMTEVFRVAETSDSFKADLERETFSNIVLAPAVRLMVTLEDVDLENHDPIGSVELRQEQLIDALNFGDALWISTSTTVADGILALRVSVIEQ